MYDASSPKSIQEMFASIAKNYDRTNMACTFGLHKKWNRSLIKTVKNADLLLDLCAGTGEIAFGFLKKNSKGHAILLDFCKEMLDIAKAKGRLFEKRFCSIVANVEEIPLEKECVDAVTVSYGIRNVKNREKCFEEVKRVLKRGGTFAILELTRPHFPLLSQLHRLYLRTFLPICGKMSSKNLEAYKYLAQSIETFSPQEIIVKLKKVGFHQIEVRSFLGGITTLFIAKKN